MPVMYESIGTYSGIRRITNFENGKIAWHKRHTVPSVAAGVVGNAFLDAVGAMLKRVEAEERAQIDLAGAWIREARAHGKRLFMYSMGHVFPDEVGKTAIGAIFKSAVWNAGFRQSELPNDTFAPGEVVVHIGYQHPPTRLFERARPAGAKVIYVSVRPHRDFVHEEGTIWIDPMWPWSDACVPIEGYEVPLLASSGIVNGAIAWEIYRLGVEASGE